MKSFKELHDRHSHNQISMRSRVYHFLGCLFLGRPSTFDMPPDFYHIVEDREMAHVQDFNFYVIRRNIRVNIFRRKLYRAVAFRITILLALIFLLLNTGLILEQKAALHFPHSPITNTTHQ